MNNETTNTANAESRKQVNVVQVSDEETRKLIEQWADGKWIYVAATDQEFSEKPIMENTGSTSSSGAKHVKTTEIVMKRMKDLINNLTVALPTRTQNEKTRKARDFYKNKKQKKEKKQEDKTI